MQSFIGESIRLGQRQGFCRWNSAHFKASTTANLPAQTSRNVIHGAKNSIKSSNNHFLQFLRKRFGYQTNDLMSPGGSGGCSVLVLSPLAAMMSSSSSRYMTTAASPTTDSSESAPVVPTQIKFKRLDKTARHIMQILDKEAVEEVKGQREIPEIKPGYIVQLKVEVPENKRRLSTIKGIVIARRNAGLNTTFRIRRMVAGVGVESLFPLILASLEGHVHILMSDTSTSRKTKSPTVQATYSPNIKDIKVLDRKKVRRAKLYYLRNKMNALR